MILISVILDEVPSKTLSRKKALSPRKKEKKKHSAQWCTQVSEIPEYHSPDDLDRWFCWMILMDFFDR